MNTEKIFTSTKIKTLINEFSELTGRPTILFTNIPITENNVNKFVLYLKSINTHDRLEFIDIVDEFIKVKEFVGTENRGFGIPINPTIH